MKIKLNELDMELYKEKLDNGLDVYLVPMLNKKNYYINYATRYGSEISEFIPAGKKEYVKVPDGVAHFLEHKMFEQEDGVDPFTFFSESGSDSNAATSYDSTQYICLGNKNFLENLKYLLHFVNSPYYTNENVEKEKGIIAEELNMYSDIPEYKLENKLRENIYKVNPRRVDIGGTVESINNITKEDLYLCYNNFYSPNNMFLLVVGNFDKDTTLDVIKKEMEFITNRGTPTIKTIKEPDKVNKQYEEITNDHINLDKVEIGLKLNYSKFKFDEKILDLYLNMITSIKFGHSSLFREFIRDNNICNNIYYEWETSFMHKVLYIMGNCMNSDEFIKEVKKEFNNDKISEEDFKRIKKVWISNIVRHYDDVEGCLDSLYDDIIRYGDIIDNKIHLIKKLKYKDLMSIYNRIDFSNISIVKMIGKE